MNLLTGTDPLSLKILDGLSDGMKVKDIPSSFGVSLDQAKRLSRYNRILRQAKASLNDFHYDKCKELGLKILLLAPLFKVEDWEGIGDLLTVITRETTTERIKALLMALEEKRERIKEFELEVKIRLRNVSYKEEEIKKTLERTKKIEEKIKKEVTFLNKFEKKETREFLFEHIGVFQDRLILAKRLDSAWQKSLKSKSIISYEAWEYVWYIDDVDALAKEFENRFFRKTPLGTSWDWKKEKSRNHRYGLPESEFYRKGNALATNLKGELDEIKKKNKELKLEQEKIQKELIEIKKESPESFLEAVAASNMLSEKDLLKHGELQNRAMKWLYKQGFIAAGEVTLPNGRRADVIGHDEEGKIVIVEVKAAVNDFKNDEKWQNYLDFCDEFYFLVGFPLYQYYSRKDTGQAGLLAEKGRTLEVIEKDRLEHEPNNREKIMHLVRRTLSRKYVFGY